MEILGPESCRLSESIQRTVDDFGSAHNDGEVELQEIMEESRIMSLYTILLKSIKRNKRLSLTKELIKVMQSIKFKTMEIENKAMINLVMLADRAN